MHVTKNNNPCHNERLLLTTNELKELLGCGRTTAVKIGVEAKAKIEVGRRVLWSKAKIQNYIEKLAS